MKEQQLTGWIDGNLTPVRVGLYQRQYEGVNYYSYWDGVCWGCFNKEKKHALLVKNLSTSLPWLPWRGIDKS